MGHKMGAHLFRGKWFQRLAVLVFVASDLLLPSRSGAGFGETVTETVLSNGLEVILLENHKAPVVTFQVWDRVGSRDETWGKTGLSHLLEHMMFKGSRGVSAEAYTRIIQENGGNFNAFTSSDFTAYFENLSADRVHVVFDPESDRMHRLVLREDDFRTELKVVMEERRLRTEDNPEAYLLEQLEATAFQIQPYHWPTVGWMEDLRRLTLEDVKAYYRKYYNPANAFVVVVGDFKTDEILPQIRRAFEPVPKGVAPGQERDVDPPQTGERRVLAKREAELPFLLIGYHVPNLHDEDSYALEVLASLLSEGKSSRLYTRLVQDKGLASNVEAEHPLLSMDPGLFMISAEVLAGKSAEEVEEAIDGELLRIQQEPVSARELQKAKNQLEADFVMGQDSIFYQAMVLARYEIVLDWRAADQYIPKIRKVGAEDVQRVASRYLVPDNRTVGTLVPMPQEKGKKGTASFSIKNRRIH
jgi:zinc protease